MKKILLIAVSWFLLQTVGAQNISLSSRTIKAQGPCTWFVLEAKTNLTNNSNDTTFEWKVIDLKLPAGWSFSLCDPFQCSPPVDSGNFFYFELGKGKSGELKADFTPNSIPGQGSVTILIYSKNNPTTIVDTLFITSNGWTTGVREASRKSNDFRIFPNPAKDQISVRFTTREAVAIDIYNMLGAKVKTVIHNGQETDINIGDLQNGVYFLRMKDSNQTISRSFTKSE